MIQSAVRRDFYYAPSLAYTLQRHNTENSKQRFPEKKLRGYNLNSFIHVSVSDLYIFLTGLPILLQDQGMDQTSEYIDRSQTHECGNWD